jgi:ATP-dependent Clp protease protease subunit
MKNEKEKKEIECQCDVCLAENDLCDDLEEMLIKTRRILLTGEITDQKSDYICQRLQIYSFSKLPVYIYINSAGGELGAGYSIIDQMELSPFPIYTICRGTAASMSATIMAYGTKGCRFITKNSTMFLHDMNVQLPENTIPSQKIAVEHLEKYTEEKMKDLISRLKINRRKFDKLLKDTSWLLPKQAIEIGLCDGIWTRKMEDTLNINSIKG